LAWQQRASGQTRLHRFLASQTSEKKRGHSGFPSKKCKVKSVTPTRLFSSSLTLVLLLHVLLLVFIWEGPAAWLKLPEEASERPLEVTWVNPAPPELPAAPRAPPPAPVAAPAPDVATVQDPAPAAAEVAALPPSPKKAAEMPKSGALAIEAYWGTYALDGEPLGRGEIRLDYPNEKEYALTLSARAVGWVSVFVGGPVELKSAGEIGPDGLIPRSFKQNTPRRPASESRFDPLAKTAQFAADGPLITAPNGLQDRLSVAFQLAWMGESQPEGLQPGQRFDIPLATHKDVQTVRFQVGDPEDLVLPGGILVTALRVTSDPFQTRRMGQIDLWLDPTDRHFPVRILYTEPSGRALDFLAIRSVF
jgi:hypothetical protein